MKYISILVYIATCIFCAYVELAYDHAIITLFIFWVAIFPIIVWLSNHRSKERKETSTKRLDKWFIIVICIISTTLACILFYHNYFRDKQSYDMWTFQATALILIGTPCMLVIIRKRRGIAGSYAVLSFLYVIVAIGTAAYLLAESPCTIHNAKEVAENAGYEDVVYISHHNEFDLLTMIIIANDPSYRDMLIDFYPDLGHYLLYAKRSGVRYAIIIHTGRAEVTAQCVLGDLTQYLH